MTQTATKTKNIGLFILLALLVGLSTGCSEEAPEVETVDLAQVPDLFEQPLQPNPLALTAEDVVITVEGEDITHGEIMQVTQQQLLMEAQQRGVPQQYLNQFLQEAYQANGPQIYKQVMDSLIANTLLTQAAEKSSLAVSDEELAESVAQFEARIPEDKTMQDILPEIGMEIDELKENLKKQLLIGKLVEEKTADIEDATLVEVEEFFTKNIASFKVSETVSANHILIAVKPEDTDETKAKKKEDIAKLREEILAGGSFEELAAENSDCPSSQQGGNLGTFGRGQMVPEFEEAAFGMTIGDVSDVVETQFGYHLIKLTDHQAEGVQTLAEVKDQLINYLTSQKKQEALMAYIEELKEKANIVEHRPDFDAAAEE